MDLSKYSLKIFSDTIADFESLAIEVYRFQYANNPVYHAYVNALSIKDAGIRTITQIPFLPIRFFKSHSVQSTSSKPEKVFESSGTTSTANSHHLIKDITIYQKSFIAGFERMFGDAKDWCIIGLLPSYLERENSSLVFMVNELISRSGHGSSGFYLNEYDKLFETLKRLEQEKQKTMLIGVTFALLDFAEKYKLPLKYTVIVETGGMKGRREEMIREQVHDVLKASFEIPVVHSEYGMTELLSQAWSKGNGVFECPPWMRVLIRDDEDPLSVVSRLPIAIGTAAVSRQLAVGGGHSAVIGAINIIDLANIYSCSFIATDDAGRLYSDGRFEVLGRIDNSDLRGCSLMVI